MIVNRTIGASSIPRNRLYRDMLEFHLRTEGKGCRVGVYKTNWVFSSHPGNWFWWCPGCQNRSSLEGWAAFPIECQSWGESWDWAMSMAWKHVREVQDFDRHDESVDAY